MKLWFAGDFCYWYHSQIQLKILCFVKTVRKKLNFVFSVELFDTAKIKCYSVIYKSMGMPLDVK